MPRMEFAGRAFIDSVEHFCEWAEGDVHCLDEARYMLLSLMISVSQIEGFRGAEEGDEVLPSRDPNESKKDHRRFSDLPFQYYWDVLDPHDLDSDGAPGLADLHDDLADIYGDLWTGLQGYRAGQNNAALIWWAESYFNHWGQHLASAWRALEAFHRQCQ